MRENDEITGLFRSRLEDAEMAVREGFWDQLQNNLPRSAGAGPREAFLTPRACRVAAAASVVFVLGAASAAFWCFSPKEEIKEAFTQVAAMTPDGSLKGDVAQETFPSIHQTNPTAQNPGTKQPLHRASTGMPTDAEEESVSVRVSITITERVYSNNRQLGNESYANRSYEQNSTYRSDANRTHVYSEQSSNLTANETSTREETKAASKVRNWALKVGLGTALPKGDFKMPLTVGASLERSLNHFLSLEAGLKYNRLPGLRTLHTLEVPVRLNAMLASSPKVDFYATVGAAIEKCIAGAPDNDFEAEPVQLSASVGLGVRYKMNDRFALFAEPSVSHHFDTHSRTKTLRTERPTNLNLLCGVRMTY